jgi:chromosome segregation ATPase
LFSGYKRIQPGYKRIQIYPTKKYQGYMSEEKRKINCWIPLSLYNKIENSGYESVTQAVIEGLERILEDPGRIQKGSIEDTLGYNQNTKRSMEDPARIQEDIEALTAENTQLKEDLSGYQKEILGYKQDIEGSRKDLDRIQEGYNHDIIGYKENIRSLNIEIARLKEALSNSPDPVELAEVRAHFEGLQRLTEEKDKRIEDLTREVETLNVFAHYFKSNPVKQIEAPETEKKKPWYKFW